MSLAKQNEPDDVLGLDDPNVEVWTEAQAAEFLKKSPAALKKWRYTRLEYLPHFYIGNSPRYTRAGCLAYMRANIVGREGRQA